MPGFEALPPALVLCIVAVIALAGFSQGALGFGFPFIATPALAMATDMRTAVIMVLLPTLATVIVTLFASGPLGPMLARFWMMPLYAIGGALAGTLLFVAAPAFPYQLLLALIILVYLNLDRLARGNWPAIRRHERAFGPLAGALAGLFEGTANVAAPPLIIYYLALGLSPGMLVQALQICFMVGKTTQFAVLTAQGGVTAAQWLATLPLVLFALAGVFVGTRVRDRIDAGTFRTWVKRALFVIAVFLLLQYVYAAGYWNLPA